MEAQASSRLTSERAFLRGRLGGLDAAVADRVVAAGGDVAMVIDRDGVICDLALSNEKMARDGSIPGWIDVGRTPLRSIADRKSMSFFVTPSVTADRAGARSIR